MKTFTTVLVIVGGALTAISIAWWGMMIWSVLKALGPSLQLAAAGLPCLYFTSQDCSAGAELAQMSGVPAYSPLLFWLGIELLGSGLSLKFIAWDEARWRV